MPSIKFEMDMPPQDKPQSHPIGPLGLMIAAMGVIISLLQFIEYKKRNEIFIEDIKQPTEICRMVETSDRQRLFECIKRQNE